jgi:hypothetical protein
MLRELIIQNRSCRRFEEGFAIERRTLEELVDLARLSASAANLQPLKYILSCAPQRNGEVFPHLAWAAYLKDWPGPAPGERPSAYVVILGDTTISKNFGCDHGIAAQSILLGAREEGLEIPARYEILLVLALGKPREQAVIDELGPGGDIRYWRDSAGVHHVPKRPLQELLVG